MPDNDLDRAVDARIDAYRPDTVPPFAALKARKRARDRRRHGMSAAALSVVAVAGIAFAGPTLTGGGGDRLTGRVAGPATPTATGRPPGMPGLRHTVDSHCGVVSTTVDGVLWLADPPLGDNNPPAGWDENDTPGVFAVQDAGDAVFTADTGVTAHFVKAPPGTSDPGGCE